MNLLPDVVVVHINWVRPLAPNGPEKMESDFDGSFWGW